MIPYPDYDTLNNMIIYSLQPTDGPYVIDAGSDKPSSAAETAAA